MPLDPLNSVGFMFGRISHLLRLNVNQSLEEAQIQLSSEELSILMVLSSLTSEKSMGPLADMLGRDPTTLKRQLNRLVKEGYVLRKKAEHDRRIVVISLTEKGQELVDNTLPLSLALREETLAGLSESERENLRVYLSKILVNLKKGVQS